jgi:hypothetical protein
MPAIKPGLTAPKAFLEMDKILSAAGDNRFCGVVAVAAACGVTAEKAAELLAEQGRKAGKGTNVNYIRRVVHALGYEMHEIEQGDFIDQRYPKAHQILASVTTHHPDRFPKAFPEGESYFMLVSGGRHIAAVVDGKLVDWSRGTSKRCIRMWRVIKVVS